MAKERESWGNKVESFLAVLGYIIGLGNIWRFPYMCFKNGGGAFLIPYSICAILIGLPMFILETALGQFMKKGGVGSWNIAPLLKGVGIGCFLIIIYCNIYYIVVMAWSVLYFFETISHGTLPWTTCDNWWNTDNCMLYDGTSATSNSSLLNVTVSPADSAFNQTMATDEKKTLAIVEYWNNFILRRSEGFHEPGDLGNWPLMLCYIGSWIICYFCTFKGVKSTGKVVYFTATFPYFVLVVLLVKGCTLPGALNGVRYYLQPNITKLAEPQVWVDAASQIIYSYGICFSTLITFASFNDFHQDCYKSAITLVASCSLTSFINGFAIFTVIGNLAYVMGVEVSEMTMDLDGPGLVFIAFPTALSLMPVPHLWNALFFFLIIVLAVDSQFSGMGAATAVIIDAYPKMLSRKYGEELLNLLLTVIYLIVGLPFMLNCGVYIFELFNNYGVGGVTMLFLTVVEAVAIGHVYGGEKFTEDIKLMIGYRISSAFKYCVMYVTPLLTLSICLYYFINYTPLKYEDYLFPDWAQVVGWMMTMSSFLCVPIFAIYKLITAKGNTIWEKIEETRIPKFGPHILELRRSSEKIRNEKGSDISLPFLPQGNRDDSDQSSQGSYSDRSNDSQKTFPVQCFTDSNLTV